MLEQIEQRRLGPVDVVDHERQRSFARTPLESFPDGPEDVLRRNAGERVGEFIVGIRFAEDLDQRPVGDAVAIGKASPGEGARLVGEHRCELAG